ncbi:GTP-binding protein TypA [Megasphaera cerevisiae DSM 20462]|jgi:GTP-binding protein|uniref:Large ribosomal subunit assembly factor BipA n=1 Tax=Megasphaera cerevisiae DSM 20462 TaxID=1122219 RepID=A0A0J6WPG6_9FIRM|nr:translational GTPase TypA [Megasphaera cerevisiae]KMO85295.1 GTP-binding protein TypA [Megasphaera cerevisiae DSM 20462]MCI1750652.1 translational GTPase TypA [Megasphaera cerevisiae]OKY54437.1 GTP-binding protein TypA [Megasphaera cerevisiae]SKA24184.1 GTP-binding protein [Megasphaera cerevisiae DSM 20462]
MERKDIRNIAIIAHVDHGKTTLVDAMLKQSHVFRANEKVAERVMDSGDIERERGITILSKNTSVMHEGVKINIVDTPGHADFGGEVERVLNMVDGVLLLVDAFEGPMPQTKYVLRKALEQKLKPIVVINKIDKPEARVSEVEDEVLELFMELDATDEQLEFPVIYANGRDGIAKYSMDDDSDSLEPLFKTIVKYCPCPQGDIDGPLQFMVTTLDYDDYVGKIAIGRIVRGRLRPNQQVIITDGESQRKAKVGRIYTYEGLKRAEQEEAAMGEIACVVGIPDLKIGETVADPQNPEALPKIDIDEPTLSMIFYVNDSPFAGQEGDFVTSRHLRDRLFREVQTNVSLRVEETDSADAFKVSGRGELHIAVLIEEMRREGYEMQVGKPSVITKDINGKKCEPLEALTIDVPQEFMGTVMEKLGTRKAEMVNMLDIAGYTRLEFIIPARGLIGFRSEFLTATKGNGIMYHVFHGYAPWKGDIPGRTRGSLVAFETGTTTGYGIFNLQDRGVMFIKPAEEIYLGQVVGESNRDVDIEVNPCKKKHLTNTRSSSSDEALRLITPRAMGLEKSLEWINDDELVEITPKSIRVRKAILDKHDRKRAMRKS